MRSNIEGSGESRRWRWIAFAWCASLALTFWGTRQLSERSPARATEKGDGEPEPGNTAAQSDRAEPRVPSIVLAPRAGFDEDRLRAIIREELAGSLADLRIAGKVPAPSEGTTRPPPATPEQQAKSDDASRFVDQAISSGRWTNDERRQLETMSDGLTGEMIMELRRRVIVAVNTGRLAVADGLPPLGITPNSLSP